MNNKNKGFTLVELIVVLVILAILAAILVPALLGYIDRAKESQDILKARNMLQASQAVLVDYYGKGKPVPEENPTTNCNTDFAKEIRKLADDDPYLTIIGVGTNEAYKPGYGEELHDQYTVYFVAYWEKKDKPPLFFDGTDWSMDYPWGSQTGRDYNYFDMKGKRINVSFVIVANKAGKDAWKHLGEAVTKFGHSKGSNDNRKK